MTGGGPPLALTNNSNDSKLMEIITQVAISGNPNVQESKVNFHFDVENEMEITEDSEKVFQICDVSDILLCIMLTKLFSCLYSADVYNLPLKYLNFCLLLYKMFIEQFIVKYNNYMCYMFFTEKQSC